MRSLHRGKKFIELMIVALLLFSLAACDPSEMDEMYTLLESSSCCPQSEQSSSYWDNNALSMAAYEAVITHYTTTKGEYTDDFGGVYIDSNGVCNICVVGSREPMTSDYLIFKQVENSYNFLKSIFDELGRRRQEFSIWMSGTCDKCNKVLICLEDEAKISSLIDYLKANNLFKKGTLNIFVGENQIVLNQVY